MESFEPKAPNGFLLDVDSSDHTFDPFDSNRFLHIDPLVFRCRFTPFINNLFRNPQLIDGLEGGLDEIVWVV